MRVAVAGWRKNGGQPPAATLELAPPRPSAVFRGATDAFGRTTIVPPTIT
jgi:hypothetical protein